jgi:hypothetical protein
VLAIAVTTALGMVLADYATIAEVTMLYLIAITVASLAGRGPSLVAASLAVAAFDFCFVPPKYTFAVSDLRYLLTFVVMFAAGLVISTLTTRLRRQERDALIRERHRGAARVHPRHHPPRPPGASPRCLSDTSRRRSVSAAVLVPSPRRRRQAGALVAVADLMPLAPGARGVRWAFRPGPRAAAPARLPARTSGGAFMSGMMRSA